MNRAHCDGARGCPGVLLMLCGLMMIGSTALIAAPSTLSAEAHVIDGDSLRLGKHMVRLWGIDAIEGRQTCTRDGGRWPCGREAAQALRAYIDGRRVSCRVRDVDVHERLVARCTVAGQDLARWMVRQGWALDYRRYSDGAYAGDQAHAERLRRNLWSGGFEPPARYRARRAGRN